MLREKAPNFLIRIAKQCSIGGTKRNILEIVEGREDARVADFRYSRHEEETQTPFISLDGGVKQCQVPSDLGKENRIIQIGRQGRVILVNEQNQGVGILH